MRQGRAASAGLAAMLCWAGTAAAVSIIVNDDLGPGSLSVGSFYKVGDTWSFYCPTGGSFDLKVDTNGTNTHHIVNNTTGLDPNFRVLDGAGNEIVTTPDTFACTYLPINMGTCPDVTNEACGVGPRHYIQVRNESLETPGGSYLMELTVRDADGVELSAKKTALGGGRKPKVPKFMGSPEPLAAPIIDQ